MPGNHTLNRSYRAAEYDLGPRNAATDKKLGAIMNSFRNVTVAKAAQGPRGDRRCHILRAEMTWLIKDVWHPGKRPQDQPQDVQAQNPFPWKIMVEHMGKFWENHKFNGLQEFVPVRGTPRAAVVERRLASKLAIERTQCMERGWSRRRHSPR